MPDIIDALGQRRARRAFDLRAVPDDVQRALWRAVSVAPSQGNTQPTRVLVARSPATRAGVVASLSEGNRGWAPAAPLLAAIASLPSHDFTVKNSDGSERELWAFNSGIAVGNLMAQATAMGLVAHPMGGFDEVGIRRAFGAPGDLRVLVVVAIGYPGAAESLPSDLQVKEVAAQDRLPIEYLVVEDRWTEEHGISARELKKRGKA